MNWKKSLCAAILVGAALTVMAGCGQTAATVPATTQAASTAQPGPSATTQSPPPNTSFSGMMPMPPSGDITGERPAAPVIDLAAAAAKLGVTQQQLTEAMGNTQQGLPDFASIAKKLGVTETTLQEALGLSNNSTPPGGPSPTGPASTAPAK